MLRGERSALRLKKIIKDTFKKSSHLDVGLLLVKPKPRLLLFL
jgi:hypothetical protein